MTLAQLPLGQGARVVSIEGDDDNSQRLEEMGLVEGTLVEVVRFAPLGDPIEIRARGYHLTLRKSEAALIEVEAESP